MTQRAIYIFAGGGSGGHLYPGLAVAQQLRQLQGDARIVFACSNRPIDREILDPLSHAVVPQPLRPLPKKLRQIGPFLWGWWSAARQVRQMLRDLRPTAVLGLGGFAAGAVVRQAARAHLRVGLLNPDAVVGAANRYLAKFAEVIFTQFETTAGYFPPRRRSNVQCVGCPVRAALLTADRAEALKYFDLREDRKTLLIFGGSLISASINEAAAALAGEFQTLADRWQVLHITGPDAAQRAASDHSDGLRVRTRPYCHRMDLAYAAADLVVCRGGASTVAELSATATPAILLPYPHHRDEQQKRNAAALTAAGAAVCIDDAGQRAANVAALRVTLLPLMEDPLRWQKMKAAAGALARPRAAEHVARWLVG